MIITIDNKLYCLNTDIAMMQNALKPFSLEPGSVFQFEGDQIVLVQAQAQDDWFLLCANKPYTLYDSTSYAKSQLIHLITKQNWQYLGKAKDYKLVV